LPGTPQPGSRAGFLSLTGRDQAVIAWLEQHDEIGQFLAQIRSLLEPTLEAYLRRHFTHLTVAFGCTGGQHRSVYCARRSRGPCERARALRWRCIMARPVVGRRRRFRLRPVSDESHGVCGRSRHASATAYRHASKALVEVAGQTLLEHVVRRLVEAGVTEVVINLHHLGEQIPPFLELHRRFGLRRVAYSDEPVLLGTGGGLKQAAWFSTTGSPSWFTMWMC